MTNEHIWYCTHTAFDNVYIIFLKCLSSAVLVPLALSGRPFFHSRLKSLSGGGFFMLARTLGESWKVCWFVACWPALFFLSLSLSLFFYMEINSHMSIPFLSHNQSLVAHRAETTVAECTQMRCLCELISLLSFHTVPGQYSQPTPTLLLLPLSGKPVFHGRQKSLLNTKQNA